MATVLPRKVWPFDGSVKLFNRYQRVNSWAAREAPSPAANKHLTSSV